MASRWQRPSWLRLAPESHGVKVAALSLRCSELVGRAQLARLLAERALHPADEIPFLGAAAVACELSREAIYWALLAHQEQQSAAPANVGEASSPEPDGDLLNALWLRADAGRLARAAGGAEQAERLRTDLKAKCFADFAELPAGQQATLAARLQQFAEHLIEPLATPQRELERAWVRRMLLLLLGLVLLIGLGFAAKALMERQDLTQDLALTASWKASSHYPECSCESPEQSCAACPNFFFCTMNEDRPSIVFDLGKVSPLSTVVVENRRDCCEERAVPLVVQVSRDEKHWHTVATREEPFTTWREKFPTQQARWVRLQVARQDFLHLARVRLFP